MNCKWSIINALLAVVVQTVAADDMPYGQERLERWLYSIEPDDNPGDDEPPYIPHRQRDALVEFQEFFEGSGWTTNQFVEGLILAVTNNLPEAKLGDWGKKRIAGRAVWKLSEIDHPAVTNFFRCFNDTDDSPLFKPDTIPAMVYYTNLEPEVVSYMRTLGVHTNVYSNVSSVVMRQMFETLSTMPDELKPAATNRVAKYMYFAIRHTTRRMGWQDRELSCFIPAYSNSLQRLSAMRYVSASATNAWERSNAAQIVQHLESLPTNQLNDVSWIAEED